MVKLASYSNLVSNRNFLTNRYFLALNGKTSNYISGLVKRKTVVGLPKIDINEKLNFKTTTDKVDKVYQSDLEVYPDEKDEKKPVVEKVYQSDIEPNIEMSGTNDQSNPSNARQTVAPSRANLTHTRKNSINLNKIKNSIKPNPKVVTFTPLTTETNTTNDKISTTRAGKIKEPISFPTTCDEYKSEKVRKTNVVDTVADMEEKEKKKAEDERIESERQSICGCKSCVIF